MNLVLLFCLASVLFVAGEDVVVIQGSSTFLRCHVFRFNQATVQELTSADPSQCRQDQGITTYTQGATTSSLKTALDKLTSCANTYVAENDRASTPIHFYGDGSMRVLSSDIQDQMYATAQFLLSSSGYAFSPARVRTLSGSEEASYLWLGLNFASNTLDEGKTLAAVDVGDASLQYAFAVSDSQAASMQQCQASQPVAPVRLQYGSKSFTLVAKSFDSMGQSQMLADAVGGKTTSPCIMSGASLSVGGAAVTGTGSFDDCKQDMLGPLGHTTCTASCSSLQCAVAGELLPTLPVDMNAVACSGFSRLATDLGLTQGQKLTSSTMESAVTALCTKSAASMSEPSPYAERACGDSTYAYLLLETGFGLLTSHDVSIEQSSDSLTLAWPLGAALLSRDQQTVVSPPPSFNYADICGRQRYAAPAVAGLCISFFVMGVVCTAFYVPIKLAQQRKEQMEEEDEDNTSASDSTSYAEAAESST